MLHNNNHIDYILIENVFNQHHCLDLYKHYKLNVWSVENTSSNQIHRLHNYYSDYNIFANEYLDEMFSEQFFVLYSGLGK